MPHFKELKSTREMQHILIKKCIKQSLKNEINNKLEKYIYPVTEEDHVENIASIASATDNKWSNSLVGASIPIGLVQKAFNLYLKLMWCLKEIAELQHCPLDKVIIDKLPYKYRKSWAKIKDIETYETLISELKKITGDKSLAVWELETYQKP